MEEILLKLNDPRAKVNLDFDLPFGRYFSEHMFVMDYDNENKWHNPVICPYGDVSFSPACMVFHYGQAIFEGMKAYLHDSGKIALFRPYKNFERLNYSAERLCIPQIDKDFLLKALKTAVNTDSNWVPVKKDYSLYLRPFIIATDPYVGVRPSHTYKFFIIMSPVGPYYPEGFKPVSIMATKDYVRAVRRGVGNTKTAGNYAASLLAQQVAKEAGYSQVLWLDAIEQKYIEEVGTMNIFIRFKDEVATPALNGSILPGVTRDSVLTILKDWNLNVSERTIPIGEVVERYKKGEVLEIFGTGTAAVISSVSKLRFENEELYFGEEPGELGKKLYDEITGIQYGHIPDRFNWIEFI